MPQQTSPETLPDADKRVTWVELFFDLVFVFAVTQAAELVAEDHSGLGVLRALVAFIPVYWVWVGTTVHANLHDIENTRGRIGIFAVALCGLILAIALPGAYHDSGILFGAAYWAARVVLLGVIAGREYRKAFVTFTVGATVTGPLMLLGGFLPDGPRLAVWAVAAAVDLSVPLLARRRLASIPFNAGHITERFGLFIIIALGETVVATAAAATHLDVVHLVALAVAFLVTCGLWWVYFAYSPETIRTEVLASNAAIEVIRPVLSYGHLGLISGIIAVSAAIGHAVAAPTEALHLDVSALLFGGVALYLTTFAFTRWRLFHTLAVPRLSAAAVCLLVLPLGPAIPATWSLVILVVILVVLNVAEHFVLPTTIRRPAAPA